MTRTTDSRLALLEQLLALTDLASFPDAKALEVVAHVIDASADFERGDGIDKALGWCDELEKRRLSPADLALLYYFRANAWHARQQAKHTDSNVAWKWNQPEVLQQISALRLAVRGKGFDDLDAVRRSQIFTNLANQLNSLGRFVDAVPLWTSALSVNPKFGMALGNRGMGLSEYGGSLYDHGHQAAFLFFAHRDLSAALSETADFAGYDHGDAKAAFANRRAQIEKRIDVEAVGKSLHLDDHSLGDTVEEQEYRRRMLHEGLFLNPLNDVGFHTIAAQDIFVLPMFTTSLDEPPTLIGLFNQMKQEFTSARWLLYEGMAADSPHFADRDVLLYNTLDYPSYSIAVEKIKAAFRMGYALFDKIAFFVNDYWKFGVNPRSVYFKTIWYENQNARVGAVHSEFANSHNWPLRGLFWLSKDIFDPDLQETAEPDAQELYTIRNCLEHTYLKVHDMLVPRQGPDIFNDRLAYSIQREDLYRKTYRVLRLARAGMIYLSLAMHHEERSRPTPENGIVSPMYLDRWRDEWKR
ncbi:LA2681 family HEPN domain-containing protein [Tardiphaga sp. 215_C5_N2_1]|uniref:LA2681 family HEPN domain-containing protein n=1 Tax=Tardiphaga sp. 215_C5_N2_1 TaxID=3240774 RepID=UPI003F893FDF